MHMCDRLALLPYFITYLSIAANTNILKHAECVHRRHKSQCLAPKLAFVFHNLSRTRRYVAPKRYRGPLFASNAADLGLEREDTRHALDENDYKAVSEALEKTNADFVDKQLFEAPSEQAESAGSTDNTYFDWNSITKSANGRPSRKDAENAGAQAPDELKTVTANVDGKPQGDLEVGERPVITGSGLNSELNMEDYAIGVTNGRINEWPLEWTPGQKVMSFFPILIDQYSLNPNPLQIGFEDSIRFRGKHVESTFNSILDKVGDKQVGATHAQVYGLCFLSPDTMQLAPLAVYAELLSKKTVVDGTGENLIVTGRVLGRVVIDRIVLEEPFIKALISPYEDDPVLREPENIPKLVDEIATLYDACNREEADIMQLLEQPYAHTRVKNRPKLFDVIDDRLNKFNIKNQINQGFAQIAAYAALDYHMNASERYDALGMQNSEDRLRFVRDRLKLKSKRLEVVKDSPRESLNDLVKQLKNFQDNRDSLYKLPEQQDAEQPAAEELSVGASQAPEAE